MERAAKKFPLVTAFQQSRETWQGFDKRQKRAAIAASAVTFGRLGLRLATERAYDKGKLTDRQAFFAHCALDLADSIDGKLARKYDAVTPWGKTADPLADKADFLIQECARMRRGQLDYGTVGSRALRDVISTATRQQEAEKTDGNGKPNGNTAANRFGKLTSAMRTVSLRLGDLMPDTTVATVSRHAATVGLGASLGYTINKRKKSKQ